MFEMQHASPRVGTIIRTTKQDMVNGTYAERINRLLAERSALVFPQMHLTIEEQVQFAGTIGKVFLVGGKGWDTATFLLGVLTLSQCFDDESEIDEGDSNDRITRAAGSEKSRSIANPSRLETSSTSNSRKARPSLSWSCMKPIDHTWLIAVGTFRGCAAHVQV